MLSVCSVFSLCCFSTCVVKFSQNACQERVFHNFSHNTHLQNTNITFTLNLFFLNYRGRSGRHRGQGPAKGRGKGSQSRPTPLSVKHSGSAKQTPPVKATGRLGWWWWRVERGEDGRGRRERGEDGRGREGRTGEEGGEDGRGGEDGDGEGERRTCGWENASSSDSKQQHGTQSATYRDHANWSTSAIPN